MSEVVSFDLAAARRWAVAARAGLAEAREQINALNVFPVPDGDTGTNMMLTLDGALELLRSQLQVRGDGIDLTEGLGLIARGMLLSARGNSGVILSQLSRGLHEAVAATGHAITDVGPEVLVEAFERADTVAWEGVSTPVEGTILSVSRAAARGARQALHPLCCAHDVAAAARSAAAQALQRTPEQLPVLATAGVVDAGGAGYLILVEALEKVLSGRLGPGPEQATVAWDQAGGSGPDAGLADLAARAHETGHDPSSAQVDGPFGSSSAEGSHEVMFLVTGSDPERASRLREHLAHLGSSVLVVGGPQEWRVHVHLDTPARALEAGAVAGHLHDITVTQLPSESLVPAENSQHHAQHPGAGLTASAVVACTPSPELARMFSLVGARTVHSAPGARASTGELLSAIWSAPGRTVVLLPNDPDTLLAAQAAARAAAEDDAVEVLVVPSLSIVQGLSAMAVWDADADAAANADPMTQTVLATTHGAVTTASKNAATPAGPCRAGQSLGLVQGRIVAVTDTRAQAVAQVLAELVGAETEILTVVEGADAEPGEIEAALTEVARRHPDVEIVPVTGRQGTYSWIFGAE